MFRHPQGARQEFVYPQIPPTRQIPLAIDHEARRTGSARWGVATLRARPAFTVVAKAVQA